MYKLFNGTVITLFSNHISANPLNPTAAAISVTYVTDVYCYNVLNVTDMYCD